jgi:hypothetical protein
MAELVGTDEDQVILENQYRYGFMPWALTT